MKDNVIPFRARATRPAIRSLVQVVDEVEVRTAGERALGMPVDEVKLAMARKLREMSEVMYMSAQEALKAKAVDEEFASELIVFATTIEGC
jgi:hypothetical protein